jgi:hypothetical protein
VLVWALVPPSIIFSSQVASYVKIFTPEKSSVNLSSRRSLKRQNTENRRFLFRKVFFETEAKVVPHPLIKVEESAQFINGKLSKNHHKTTKWRIQDTPHTPHQRGPRRDSVQASSSSLLP